MRQLVIPLIFLLVGPHFLKAQAPEVSNQVGSVQQLPLEGAKTQGKSAHLPGLDFYAAVVDRILSGKDEPARVQIWHKNGEPPKPMWYVRAHVAPSFTEDSLFELRQLTDESLELVVICPRGGINFWYQLSTPCMTEKPMTVDEAVTRLAYVRFQLTEKQFPAIRGMMTKFREIRFPAFVSPIRMVLDGVSYDFKVKSPEWSYELHTSNPDEDFPLAVWAESCASEIWKFLRTSKEHGFEAHPITSVDKECIGPAILRSDAGSGEIDEVDRLLRLGVNVNAADFWNRETALMQAVMNHQLSMIKRLLAVGADPKRRDESGRSLFHLLPDTLTRSFKNMEGGVPDGWKEAIARLKDRLKIADMLLAAGVDLEAANSRGESPLMAAVEAEDVELTRWFLAHGSKATRKDPDGKSALDRAKERKNPTLIRVLGEKE